jgi:hypothetical protein
MPRKLLPKYIGPYRITQIKGTVAGLQPIPQVGGPTLHPTSAVFERIRLIDEARFDQGLPGPVLDPGEIDPNLETEEKDSVNLVRKTETETTTEKGKQ